MGYRKLMEFRSSRYGEDDAFYPIDARGLPWRKHRLAVARVSSNTLSQERGAWCGRGAPIDLTFALAGGANGIAAEDPEIQQLYGLWETSRHFPASVAGSLLLLVENGHMVADVDGYRVPVTVNRERLSLGRKSRIDLSR